MTIEEAFWAKVTGVAAISAIVGTRVYPIFVPQTGKYPCITYTSQLEIRGKSNAGTNGLNKTNIEIHCWETTDALAHVLGAAVVTALKNQSRVTWGTSGVKIAKCDIESDDENLEQVIGNDGLLKFGIVFNAAVWYVEQ